MEAWRPHGGGVGHTGAGIRAQCAAGWWGSGREDRQVESRLEFCRRGLMDAQGSGVLVERSGRSMDSG